MQFLEGEREAARQARRSVPGLFLSVLGRMWLYGVLAYVVRNVFQAVPFPLQDVRGYRHLRTKEVLNSAVYMTSMMLYDSNLHSDVAYLKHGLGSSGARARVPANNVRPRHPINVAHGRNRTSVAGS
jgi:hypothetical protein